MARFGLAAAVTTGASFTILQAVDGIALKRAVDTWVSAPSDQQGAAFAAAEAIRFALETFRPCRMLGAWMQVGDERFDGDAIQRLYDSSGYIPCRGGRRPAIDTPGRFDVMAPLTYIAARNQFSACLATLPRQGAQLSSPKLG